MATKTIQPCDLCRANASTTATLALDGTTTEVDLCARHARELTAATKAYVTVGRTTGRSRAAKKAAPAKKEAPRKAAAKKTVARKGAAKKAAGRKRVKATSKVAGMRAWGYANGFNVASKGRLKPDLVAAFEAAQE